MTSAAPTTARRPWRRAVVGVLALVLVALSAGHATAAGTGGIEVTPVPGIVDGKQVTAFRVELPGSGTDDVPFLLRNVEDGERTATLYAAEATRSSDGSFAVGDAGSSPYVSYEQRTVTLAKGEQREESFTVERPDGKRPPSLTYAAIVVEVNNGSVVQRAATLVYLEPGTSLPVSLPLLIVVVALVLLLAAALAVWLAGRRVRGARL